MLLPRTREEIVARAELHAADRYGTGQNDHFFGPVMRVARKPCAAGQSHDGRTAARIVAAKQAALDTGVVRGFPLAIPFLLTSTWSLREQSMPTNARLERFAADRNDDPVGVCQVLPASSHAS